MDVLRTTLVLLILLSSLSTHQPGMQTVEGVTIDCNGSCSYRCSKSSRQKMCLRACNTCCVRCNCVPPGTSGNTELCPCYSNMTTHGGRLKCP